VVDEAAETDDRPGAADDSAMRGACLAPHAAILALLGIGRHGPPYAFTAAAIDFSWDLGVYGAESWNMSRYP
jgi:hypothetical protein